MNVLVSSFFLVIASILIPFLVVKKIRNKNKKLIVKKTASVIQEICEFINDMPYTNNISFIDNLPSKNDDIAFIKDKLYGELLIIGTSKKSKIIRHVGISSINALNKIVVLEICIVFSKYMETFDTDTTYKILKDERNRLEQFRLKLESIITIYSLHVDENVISVISDLCLDIKAFEIKFKDNFAIDDLIESGKTKRTGVFGIMDVADIYKKILETLEILIRNKNFETEIKKTSELHFIKY
ncbi:hypothetical protein [Flavobacterium sp. LS1R10]|uniref:hypothetical protein n=1 Tax=Flavobacterium sp. LS1R10 TaxID=2497482 RepID=UPI000F83B349|nr:hypothetical protein [Flavobacterium sp. LS1R10]RTY75147.1 hypothetical protein EKL96_05185 [Flavobacterium sp. LS1R10]